MLAAISKGQKWVRTFLLKPLQPFTGLFFITHPPHPYCLCLLVPRAPKPHGETFLFFSPVFYFVHWFQFSYLPRQHEIINVEKVMYICKVRIHPAGRALTSDWSITGADPGFPRRRGRQPSGGGANI